MEDYQIIATCISQKPSLNIILLFYMTDDTDQNSCQSDRKARVIVICVRL